MSGSFTLANNSAKKQLIFKNSNAELRRIFGTTNMNTNSTLDKDNQSRQRVNF